MNTPDGTLNVEYNVSMVSVLAGAVGLTIFGRIASFAAAAGLDT
ncbi:MAG: hypothetical protein ACKO3T_27460 [Planctomycetaceae bacterium]